MVNSKHPILELYSSINLQNIPIFHYKITVEGNHENTNHLPFHSFRTGIEILTMFISFHYLQARYIQVDTLKLVLNSFKSTPSTTHINSWIGGQIACAQKSKFNPAIGNV